MNTQTSLQNAIDIATNELALHGVDIKIMHVPTLSTRDDVWGIVTAWRYPDSSNDFYMIKLQTPQPTLIETLGHELHHVWEFENGLPPDEAECDIYGQHLAELVGAELRCCKCQKKMTNFEAEESEHGAEFTNELICDGCFNIPTVTHCNEGMARC